jgi:hypothetical protein
MQGLARILADDDAVGAGFLISPRHLTTCAHVVNVALGRDAYTADCPDPARTIWVDFPNAERDPVASSAVDSATDTDTDTDTDADADADTDADTDDHESEV